jgi:hypothetical protein
MGSLGVRSCSVKKNCDCIRVNIDIRARLKMQAGVATASIAMRSGSSVPVAVRFWSLLYRDWNSNVVKLCDVFAHESRAQRGGELA